MSKDLLPWLAASLVAAVLAVPIAFSNSWGALVLITLLFTVLFAAIASGMRTQPDHAWLLRWVVLGFLAKIVGTLARYYMVAVLYGGGDSYRYYRVGTEIAAQFRMGRIPEFAEPGAAFGTRVLEFITGGLFTLYTPDMLGGFLIFSIFAFGGQLMLYAAFRRGAEPTQLKPYAFFIFFLPTYAFWPSSIGKDAMVIFAVGGAAYFIARILESYEVRWLLGLATFLGLLGLIRIHVAGLVVLGLIAAGILSRMPTNAGAAAKLRRLLILGGFVAAGGLVLTLFPNVFGVDLTGGDLDSFTSDVVRRTSEAGTVASGGIADSPSEIPGAIALVLFRPFAFEATELQHFFAAAETTLLLAITIWKLPAILRNRKEWRRHGYIVFSTMYVLAYSVAFSVVRNLGIVARQRGQVLAFFLCVLVGLGWGGRNDDRRKLQVPTPLGTRSSTPPEALRSRDPARVR